jgi:uncharacterized membrane-anchored protein
MTTVRFNYKSLAVKYAAIVALPLALLLTQPVKNFIILSLGERVLLETLPVDPRDLLRGDYVELRYVISDIPDSLWPDAGQTREDDYPSSRYHYHEPEIFISLKVDEGGVGTVKGAAFERPAEGLYLRGRGSKWYSSRISYGLEAYFVPEGTGKELERAVSDHKVLADVRVLRGHGVINRLIVGDKLPEPEPPAEEWSGDDN